MNSAYKAAISELSYALSSGLLNKRDMLLAQVHRISHRMDEINYVRSIIEKDIKGEFGGILDRLKNAEGKKVAVIQNEMAQLQSDIERIDALVANYEQIKGDRVLFLLRSRSLREDVESLLLKAFKTDIDQTPYDLPRELKELREKLERKNVGQQLLKLKDEIIWKLFNDRKNREVEAVEKFNNSVANEIESWAKLADKYAEEYKRYQLICYFCSEPMGPANINKKCKINEKKEMNPGFTGFTSKRPEPEYLGNSKHFFARPKENLFNTNQAFDNLQNMFNEQQAEVIKKKTMWEIENNLVVVKKLAREKNINIDALLRSHDPQNLGIMSHAKFIYLLSDKLGVSQDRINCFMILLDPHNKRLVNYRDFLQMLNDPDLLKVDRQRDNPDDPNNNIQKASGLHDGGDVLSVGDSSKHKSNLDLDINSRVGGFNKPASQQGGYPAQPRPPQTAPVKQPAGHKIASSGGLLLN